LKFGDEGYKGAQKSMKTVAHNLTQLFLCLLSICWFRVILKFLF